MKGKTAIKSVFAFALLAAVFLFVSPTALMHELASISLKHVALLLLISFVLVWVSCLKWRVFLGADAPSTMFLFRLYLIGYFVNTLVPSYVGGDAARSYLAGKRAGQANAASATILERYTGLVAMFALGLIASLAPFGAIMPLHIRLVVIVLALGLAIASLLVLWKKTFLVVQRFVPLKSAAFLANIRSGLIAGLSNRKALAQACVLSLIYHCFTVLNVAIAAQAVGWDAVPIWQLFVVLPVILTIGGLPLTPSGLGLQEGAFVYFLALLGASHPESLAIGILLRAKTFLLAIIGGVFFVFEQRGSGKGYGTVANPLPLKFETQSFGAGRTQLVILAENTLPGITEATCFAEYKTNLILVDKHALINLPATLEAIESALSDLGVRSAIFIGIADAGAVLQALALRSPKMVKTMILIDSTSRPYPSAFMSGLARLEAFLPLGLPFRNSRNIGSFDSLPFAHRLRSPCTVAVSNEATTYQRAQARVLAARLPTAILLEANETRLAMIEKSIAETKAMPARCPQKNLPRND